MNRYRVFVAAAALALAATPLTAQEFTIQSATTFKMGGVLGFAARMGGMPKETFETTYLSGHKLRTDNKDSGTIIDADAGVFTMINKKDKWYTTMSFDQMAAMMKQAQAQAKASQQQAQAEAAKNKKENGDVEVKYSAKVDVTGKQEQIAGFNAKQALLTLSADASARPEGEKDMQQAGSLVVLVDMWNTEAAPHAQAMKSFQDAYAKKAASELGSGARGMEALYASYPGMKEAMEAAAKEMKKVPGISVRTATYIVLVPPDKKFDRELAMSGGKADDEKKEEKKGGFGKALGGLLAPKKQEEQSGQQAEAKQSNVMVVTNEVREVKRMRLRYRRASKRRNTIKLLKGGSRKRFKKAVQDCDSRRRFKTTNVQMRRRARAPAPPPLDIRSFESLY
jgi:hypothetical protein